MDVQDVIGQATTTGSGDSPNIDELMEQYDLDDARSGHRDIQDRDVRQLEARQWIEEMEEMPDNDPETVWQAAGGLHLEGCAQGGEPVEMADEIGRPGTKFYDGELEMEQVGKYAPFQVRGVYGEPGLLDKQYRQEPVIRDSIDSIVEIQMSADRFVDPPEAKYFASDQRHQAVVEWSRRMNLVFNNLESNLPHEDGFARYVADAANSVATFGFSPHEVVWRNEGWQGFDTYVPKKIPYRETSTVWRWVMDNSHSRLVAIDFNTSTDIGVRDSPEYTLPVRGPRLRDHKAVVARLSARGANWEGVAPARSTQHWIKFKQLLGQIAAATAQKYGVPTTFIRLDPSFFSALPNPMDADQGAIKEVVDKLDIKQATECAIVGLPGGLEADLQSPAGTMPDFEDLIRYCDEQIAKPYSNEGSLLGHEHGSYALAESKDNAFMRSAPMYNRVIMEPINGLMRMMAREEFGVLPAYPTMKFKLNAMHDAESFVEDVSNLFAPNESVTRWPEKVRKAVAKKLGMRENAFDLSDEELQRRIMRRIQQKQEGSARPAQTTGEDFPPADEPRGPAPSGDVEEMAEPVSEEKRNQEGFDPQRAQAVMDTAEDTWAEAIYEILQEQTQEFEDRTEGVQDPQAITDIAQEIQQSYQTQLRETLDDMGAHLASRGARHLAEGFGVQPGVAELAKEDEEEQGPGAATLFAGLAWLDARNKSRVQAATQGVATELSQRNVGKLRGQHLTAIDTPDERQMDGLAKGTVATSLTSVTSTSYNAGRDQLMRDAKESVTGQTLELKPKDGDDEPRTVENPEETMRSIRSSMLDGAVCDPCRRLDNKNGGPIYVVGSSRYFNHHPPKRCVTAIMGDPNCRCIMIHWDSQGGDVIRRGIESQLG